MAVVKTKTTSGLKRTRPGAEVRAARAKANHVREAVTQQVAAREEIRRRVAEWVAIIRNRVCELKQQVGLVMDAARAPGSVLGLVIDTHTLSELNCDLDAADCSAMSLTIAGEDLPVPDLVAYERYLMENTFPLAGEGVKIMAGDDDAEAGP